MDCPKGSKNNLKVGFVHQEVRNHAINLAILPCAIYYISCNKEVGSDKILKV